MKKRIIPSLLALLLIVAAVAFSIQAADTELTLAEANSLGSHDLVLDPDSMAVCPVCGGSVKWTAMPEGGIFASGHYYVPDDYTYTGTTTNSVVGIGGATICLHLNGNDLSIGGRIFAVGNTAGKGTVNIIGSGNVTSTGTAQSVPTLYCSGGGTLNLYGGTYTIDRENYPVLQAYKSSSAIVNIYAGASFTDTDSDNINSEGVLSIYGGTVNGGMNVTGGTLKLSGAPKITGLTLKEGLKVDLSGGLEDGANIQISANGIFTQKGMSAYAGYFTPVSENYMILMDNEGALSCVPKGTVLVAADGSVTTAEDILAEWNTKKYSYIKLYGDAALTDLDGAEVTVDLNGNDLIVGGTGKLNAFDSANDTYEASACGAITNNGTVEIVTDVAAPNGNRYIAITDGTTTMHRLDMRMKAVSLRTTAAGLYYKSVYYCDTLLSAKVKNYGVVLSVDNMPGSDFLNEAGEDINAYTVAEAAFESGVTATSGAVFGIMKAEREASTNASYGEMEIYANAYIQFAMKDLVVVGDTKNANKTTADADFTGTAWSLHEVMDAIDEAYYSYSAFAQERVDQFYYDWDEDGMGDWDFVNIGGVNNSDLSVGDDGIDYCPVCKKDVQWTALTDTTQAQNLKGHYYLTGDLKYAGKDGGGYIYNATGNTTLCLHLNSHSITATGTRAIFGSSGRVNIMGKGEVAGYNGSAKQYGAAVQINNSVANNGVYIYGGTWKKVAGSSDKVAVLGTNTVGGTIHVYKGATVEATGDLAVQTSVSISKDAVVGLYGCTVNGDVVLNGISTKHIYDCMAEILNCTVNGDVRANGQGCEITVDGSRITGTLETDDVGAIELGHDVTLGLLDMEGSTLITMNNMTDGADIPVANTGVLTQPHDNAADWAKYFHPQKLGDVIEVENGVLSCRTDYTSKLNPDAEGKAVCPVCREIVVWTPVSTNDRLVAEKDGHYYLTTDILFEKEYSEAVSYLYGGSEWRNGSACFHLNGHNITATKTHAIYGGYGVLNIMGDGVVTGCRAGSTQNAAVQVNNSVTGNGVNLYSGTYQKSANSGADTCVVGIQDVGGALRIYEDVEIRNSGSNAMYIGISTYINSTLELHNVTVPGNVTVKAPTGTKGNFYADLTIENVTVTGVMNVELGNEVNLNGVIKIGKLTLPAGQKVTIGDLAEGSAITVSADGFFTNTTEKVEQWLKYITCADEGDWIFERDKQLYQGARASMAMTATNDAADIAALETVYAGKTVKYGEMHNHTNTGPRGGLNTGADGRNSLAEWIEEMDRLKLDFATIVDHGQSIHMYHENWNEAYFVGGTEPSTTIIDSKAIGGKTPHYNMLFSDPADLEAIMYKWSAKYAPISQDGYEGLRLKYANFSTADFSQLAKDIYAQGGLMVHVHPKYDKYIYSDDPLDYYFADNTGLEITTGKGGNMVSKDNEEAYQLWVDLLQLGKKIWATAGSDIHHLPDTSALTTMYTDLDHCDTYLAHMRTGNFAPGWVGIRMNVNGTAMGGQTAFTGQRLQFSVGDIYRCDEQDTEGTAPVYVEGHTYRVELYDDGGLLMESVVDPTQMNYFAIDCDETAKFYRVVVWDDTEGTRIGVSNPIWNTEA